jgi:HrpA-like RNA helicase
MLQKSKIKIAPHMSDYEINKINTIPAKEYIMDWFRKRVPARRGGIPIIKAASVSDRLMILRSGTGSGKSTTLGPELYINFYEATRREIAVTQPRVLTAMQIPDDISSIYTEIKMGDNIGFQTGNYVYKPKKGIIFMTIGVLAQQLKVMGDDEFMQKYAFVVIDETHDRSLGMDLALSLTKQYLNRNYAKPDCPFFILTSATFDVDKYSDYFGVDRKNVIDVMGLNYPIQSIYPEVPLTDYIQAAVDICLDIHIKNINDYEPDNRFTDILIFVYGAKPMRDIKKKLDAENNNLSDNNFVVIGLTGESFGKRDEAYQNIFKPLSSIEVVLGDKIVTPRRRIIISTDVAETGVTIDTLRYLIDSGYVNSSLFDPTKGASALIPKSVTQSSALQRKGRVGRRAPGVYYPLYTEDTFNKMQVDKYPEIISSDICDMMLGLIIKNVYPDWDGVISEIETDKVFDIDNIDMMDYPAVDSLNYAMQKLFVLGMIDANCKPTIIGLATTCITKIPIEITRMIIAGYQQGANVLDLITIGAFLYNGKRSYVNNRSKEKYSYESTFEKNEKELYYYNKFFIADDFIETIFIWEDLMAQLKEMKSKLSINHIKNWCDAHGFIYEGFLKIIATRDSIIEAFIQSVGLDPFYNGAGMLKHTYSLKKIFKDNMTMGIAEIKKIKKCIYEGFKLNVATWSDERRGYILDTYREKIKIKSDVIEPLPPHETFGQQQPKKIIVKNIDLSLQFNKLYQYECDTVSVMDGYVDIDETFIES